MDPRRTVLVAAVVLAAGWTAPFVAPILYADALAWSAGLQWTVQCQTVVYPWLGDPHCVATLGVLGVVTAAIGLAAAVAAFVAVRRDSERALAVAHVAAAVAGAILAVAIVVGVARRFSGLAEVPFDVAALVFAAWPAMRLRAVRRDGRPLARPVAAATPTP